jgi:glucose/arabinose dehydrogenase
MPRLSLPRPCAIALCATLVTGTALPALSQSMLLPRETAQAHVQRDQPAQAPYSDSIVFRLQVPRGFTVNVFASGLRNVRMLEVAPDGTVYATRREQGDVLALRDADGDGRAESVTTFVAGLRGVHGIAQRAGELLLANSTTVWRMPLAGGTPVPLIQGLPEGGQHPNRMVRVGPDGALYVSVGSSCNDCAEENQLERATVIRYAADGSSRTVIANGLRNTIGYDWHPASGELWGMDHGSDFRGDHVPPEELNRIVEGGNYGWPICYANQRVDAMTNAAPARVALEPGQDRPSMLPLTRREFCERTEPARGLYHAHAAPMAMRFYSGSMFPERHRGDAFVALRGSWNRGNPVGYAVLRIRFDERGRPHSFDEFLTGFLDRDGSHFYGRPVGIAIAADGALLVSDDTNGAIYRVAWTGRH